MTVEREFLRRIATGSVGYTNAQSAFVGQQLRLTSPGTARKSKPSRTFEGARDPQNKIQRGRTTHSYKSIISGLIKTSGTKVI